MLYLWIKAFHLISMVAWFSGLFYLPRLYVYHVLAEDALGQERFQVMEHKLFWFIATPAGISTTFFGVWMLVLSPGLLQLSWMHAKLFLVLVLWGFHVTCGYYLRQFKSNPKPRSDVFFRVFNEIPTVLLIAIMLLVMVR